MFLSEALPGLSLNPKALFDVLSSSCFLYMGGVIEGILVHVSFSACEGISLEMPVTLLGF